MNDYVGTDIFGFEPDNDKKTFDYNDLSGLGQSDYENEDIFNAEVDSDNVSSTFVEFKPENSEEQFDYNLENTTEYKPSDIFTSYDNGYSNYEEIKKEMDNYNSFGESNSIFADNQANDFNSQYSDFVVDNYSESALSNEQIDYDNENVMNPVFDFKNNLVSEEENTEESDTSVTETDDITVVDKDETLEIDKQSEEFEDIETSISYDEVSEENIEDNLDSDTVVTDVTETFEETEQLEDDGAVTNYTETSEESDIEEEKQTDIFSVTPIEELNKLTEYAEEKIQTTDIKELFDRVGVNVKEASDIFKKNTEMKEKIDSRFEQLKKLQSEVEKAKKAQYDEINSYKEEVLNKLTDKKEEIEKRLNKLKEYQASLEKEKQEFEQYRKTEKEEIERVQREVQDAYDTRREELSHIEDVLRKQKDALDEERSQLSLDRIQYEADKNELANNLLKFNEIVDSFTNGMDKINKE